MFLAVLQQGFDADETDLGKFRRIAVRVALAAASQARLAQVLRRVTPIAASPAMPVAARVPPDGSPREKANAPTQMVPLLSAMSANVLIRATLPVNSEKGDRTGD